MATPNLADACPACGRLARADAPPSPLPSAVRYTVDAYLLRDALDLEEPDPEVGALVNALAPFGRHRVRITIEPAP